VRKKRKPSAAATTEPSEAIQDLAASVVRKKPKLEPAPDAHTADSVNTLTSGLVRKKPKAWFDELESIGKWVGGKFAY
jgi:hypothetical protein